jgi:hypothetical protein
MRWKLFAVLVIGYRKMRVYFEFEPTSDLWTLSTALSASTWGRLSFEDCGIRSLMLELDHETGNAEPDAGDELPPRLSAPTLAELRTRRSRSTLRFRRQSLSFAVS